MATATTTTVIDAMTHIYANLVVNDRRTIASLPADYQAPVTAYIKTNYPDYTLGA